ncbi:ABC-three component system middle component 6 [Leptospirillum ferriphilum]|uniref:ABC-three component system middle component 6 n=1 Tax=Leptospirillum ferriphilum TaxID=178606 RepID=UPI0009EC8872
MSSNLHLAISPHEHLRFSDSVLGLAGLVRLLLTEPSTLDELEAHITSRRDWPGSSDIAKIALAVTLLFAIGSVRTDTDGRIQAIR